MLLIDQIGRRYGRLPSEVLDLDPWELGLAIHCVQQADSTSAQMVYRIRSSKGGMVFPVVVVRD